MKIKTLLTVVVLATSLSAGAFGYGGLYAPGMPLSDYGIFRGLGGEDHAKSTGSRHDCTYVTIKFKSKKLKDTVKVSCWSDLEWFARMVNTITIDDKTHGVLNGENTPDYLIRFPTTHGCTGVTIKFKSKKLRNTIKVSCWSEDNWFLHNMKTITIDDQVKGEVR